jgi:hypothetical protein
MANEPININSLFADVLPDPAAEMRQQQQDLLSVLGTTGGVAALNMPRQAQQMRAAAGGLFGVDTRTGSEKLREAMKGLDPNNPQDLIRLASMADAVDPAKGIQLRQAAAQMTAQQQTQQEQARIKTQQRNAMMDTVMSTEGIDPAVQNAAISAIEAGSYDGNIEGLIDVITPNKDRFDVKDGAVWDNFKGEWKVAPNEGIGGLEAEKLNPDDYTPESWFAYSEAVDKARQEGSPEALRKAILNLKPTLPDGWTYENVRDAEGNKVLDENGIPKQVQKPVGDKLAEYTQQVAAANRGRQMLREKTGDVLTSIGMVEDALEEGTETGFVGTFAKIVPGTDTYTLSADVDSILANLGYGALQEARTASSNGSSGFGQLTQKELEDLRSLVTTLKVGLKKEDFKARLDLIKKNFERARKRAQGKVTLDQWIGIEQVPEDAADANDLTTDDLYSKYGVDQ